jgi:hypothetical protein
MQYCSNVVVDKWYLADNATARALDTERRRTKPRQLGKVQIHFLLQYVSNGF